jgi:hypothetical protein
MVFGIALCSMLYALCNFLNKGGSHGTKKSSKEGFKERVEER